MKKILAAITVPGLLLGGAAVAGAQTADEDVTDDTTVEEGHKGGHHRGPGKFAEALGMTGEELRDALAEGQTLAQIAVTQNVDIDTVIADMIVDAQAKADEDPDSRFAENFDATEFEERLNELVNNEIDPSQGGHGRRGRGGPGGPGGAIAEALGLEGSELRDALAEGSTIAEIASEQGVDIDSVIDQIVADAEARVTENPDSRFAENFDADAFEEKLTEKVTSVFDPSDRPARGSRGGPRGPQEGSGVDA